MPGWHYYSCILHGITIHEFACCAYFILSKGFEDPAQLRKPLFLCCVFTMIMLIPGFAGLTAVLNWRMNVLDTIAPSEIPKRLAALNAEFIPPAMCGSVA